MSNATLDNTHITAYVKPVLYGALTGGVDLQFKPITTYNGNTYTASGTAVTRIYRKENGVIW